MNSVLDSPGGTASGETLRLDSLHHVAIQVDDIVRAVDWYLARFNTRVDYQDESWALLGFENISLALVRPDQHPAHIAVTHRQAETFGRLTRHRDGTESVYIQDSEGNSVEIMKVADHE